MTALKRCIFSGLENTSGHVLMEKKKKKELIPMPVCPNIFLTHIKAAFYKYKDYLKC